MAAGYAVERSRVGLLTEPVAVVGAVLPVVAVAAAVGLWVDLPMHRDPDAGGAFGVFVAWAGPEMLGCPETLLAQQLFALPRGTSGPS
jgi:hypothetical protein